MEEITRQVLAFILALRGPEAYAIVGALMWAEAPFFLGLVTPGEIAMAVGGVLAFRGQVTVAGMAAAAAGGTMLGNTMGFWLGRRWGGALPDWGPLRRVLGGSVENTRQFLARRGEWAVVVGQFVSYVRIFVPFLVGASGMPLRRYLAYGLPTALIWSSAWVLLGFGLGEGWQRLREVAGPASFLVLALFLAALVIRWMAVRVARQGRRVRAAVRRLAMTRPVRWTRRGLRVVWAWLARRFDPGLARGLGLTLGLLIVLAGGGGIGVVLDQVQEIRGIARMDYPALAWMAAVRTEAAVGVARTGLTAFRVPGFVAPALLLALYAWWRVGWGAALRVAVGTLGGGLGAYLLDEYALHSVVPRAGYPSLPVVVAAALTVHGTAVVGSRRAWGRSVAAAAVGLFLLCAVGLATMVAGWAAPSGIALGTAVGLTWSTSVELSGRIPAMASEGGPTGDPTAADGDAEGLEAADGRTPR